MILPAADDIERAILGSCLLDQKHVDSARVLLRPADFHLDSHRRIFSAISSLDDADGKVDLITVTEALNRRKELNGIGGVSYLAGLTEGLPRRPSIEDYVAIVKEKSKRRKLIQMAEQITAGAMDVADNSLSIVSRCQDSLQAILDDSDTDNPHVAAYSASELNTFESERKKENAQILLYGLAGLDIATGGMRHGEVTLVGARPGVGKTSIACQVITANCIAGVACSFFSLEMTRAQILRRLWSIVSGVPFARIRRPWLANTDDVARIREAADTVVQWPLRIRDKSEMHVSEITASARVDIRRHSAQLILVDYAQEVDADGNDERTRVMRVAKGLTRMIKHEPAALMLLSQLVKGNRDSYNRAPIVNDLVESGKLEQVAHTILLLHRQWDEEQGRIAEDAEIIMPKQRGGDTATIRAKFNRRTVVFEEV